MQANRQFADKNDPAHVSARQGTPPAAHLKLLAGAPMPAPVVSGLEEMDVEYDADRKIVWCHFNFAGRPSFTQAVFRDITRVGTILRQLHAGAAPDEQPVRWVVL